MKSIYKSAKSKSKLMELYEEKLESLQIDYEEIDVKTSFGRTRVIKAGNENSKTIVLFHGINAGAPLTLEAVKDLRKDYLLYAIDTIGQANKSEENRINIKDNSFALWAAEVLRELHIEKANFIGISYGAYILQKLITHYPEKVEKCIFIVPGGLVNGKFLESMKKLTVPLLKFLLTKKDTHLNAFTKSFVPEEDEFMFRLQKEMLVGLNMDYRRPILLEAKDVQNFSNPVYMIVADDDVFFPGDDAIKKAKTIFKNFKEAHILKNCKHMPFIDRYPEIQLQIKTWIEQ
jgi:pimeloyl-ACP methyl ester carboxylesterase